VRTRIAGTAAGILGYVVLSQDALALTNTLHLLFASTLLLAMTDAGTELALVPDKKLGSGSGAWLIRVFVVSIYFWSGIAKSSSAWLSGDTLERLVDDRILSSTIGPLLRDPTPRVFAAWSTVLIELALGPLLLVRRSRKAAIGVAIAFHATLELILHPDFFGWLMLVLLISFADRSTDNRPTTRPD
jgi:hypothetical protein